MSEKFQKDLDQVATEIDNKEKNIILIHGFNGSGKTQLSVSFKNLTQKNNSGKRSGVYYNAFSEDLFDWDNDENNDGTDFKLLIKKSSLNKYHQDLEEKNVNDKLREYKPTFDWQFESHGDPADGFRAVRFVPKNENRQESTSKNNLHVSGPIKISRGEEQIFKWCFFLALFENGGLTGEGNSLNHFFIDDPLSSLDDHNIFITISSLMELIENHYKTEKIIITTHHVVFFSILINRLTKGSKADKYKDYTGIFKLKNTDNSVKLVPIEKETLYHLELLKIIKESIEKDAVYQYHFVLLRQVIEFIGSFLGLDRFSYVLKEIGISDYNKIFELINTKSHKSVFSMEHPEVVPEEKETIKDIYEGIEGKYNFKLQ